MLREVINGFFMSLADSVPGVSGGTVAFIMGFYDRFIGSIHNFVFGNRKEKKESLHYLVKLGIGWIIGMISSVLVLSYLFDSHIYTISSIFVGFIAGSIPLILKEEKESFREIKKGIFFFFIGIIVVTGIAWINGHVETSVMDLSKFSISSGIRLFFIGMFAISAMFLPGMSGSTVLLIFGAYIPVITAVKGVIGLNFSYIPALMFFGFGILVGVVTVIKVIKLCIVKYRTQTVYMILGMMIGSFYAIVKGPTTLEIPKAAMNLSSFEPIACIFGLVLVIGLQKIKEIRK